MQKLERRIETLELTTHKSEIRYVVVPRGFIGPIPENVIAVCTGVPRNKDFGRQTAW